MTAPKPAEGLMTMKDRIQSLATTFVRTSGDPVAFREEYMRHLGELREEEKALKQELKLIYQMVAATLGVTDWKWQKR